MTEFFNNADIARSVRQTTDGGYIIAGSTEYRGGQKTAAYVIRTDADGNEIWSKDLSPLGR